MNNLGNWLIQERKERRWSQSELARRAGISRQAISNYESDKIQNPDPDVLRSIAKALRRPEEIIFRAAGIMSPARAENPLHKEAADLLDQLPEDEQQEWVDMLRWKVTRRDEQS